MALTATEEALVRQLLDQQAAILSLAGNESTITSKLGATKVTLSNLVAVSAVADADLLLTRQGTNDKSVTAALLAQYMLAELGSDFVNVSGDTMAGALALFGGDTGVTPPQFDNDTSLVTSAFVQRALGSLRTLGSSNVTATMTAAHVGGLYAFYGNTASQTITLPDATSFPTGASVWFVNQATQDVTLAGNGAAIISANNAGLGQTTGATLLVSKGDSLMLSYNGGGQWNAHGYTSQKQFPSSLATSGYQKLPSGLIIQWGSGTTNASGIASVTFPISFPTTCDQIVGTVYVSGLAANIATAGLPTTSGVSLYACNGSAVALNATIVRYLAIGR